MDTPATPIVRPDLIDQQYGSASNLMFNEKIKSLLREGQEICHFGFGQSPFPVFENAVTALRKHASVGEYLAVQGLPELRQGICEFHKHYDKFACEPDDVIVGPGSKELIFLLMMIFNGDVLINSPSWTTYRSQAILSGHSPFVVESCEEDEWRITSEGLEKVIRENKLTHHKLLILTNPCNPTGTCYTEEHLKALAGVCRRHNVIVLSDEIYARTHYKGGHMSLCKIYPEGAILSSGMSKWASAGGWRIGYNIFPKELSVLKSMVRNAASHSYSCAPAPMQAAFAEVLRSLPDCDDYIRHTTRIMRAVGQFCARELRSAGVKVVEPTAGYYIFPNFEVIKPAIVQRGVNTCAEMCSLMLAEIGVAVMPGGPDHLRPKDELTTRLCFVNFDGSAALDQSRKLGPNVQLQDPFVKDFCWPVFNGIKKIKIWIEKLNSS
ncbi:unnamed protein product [Lymnaea stagnalis]|uniref:Aminotransferase class I/classII large domain-containing protein n=1 Tax=Lymnaea stagnalis TaxID=6523 RepID=A0AAV2H749_LYMST